MQLGMIGLGRMGSNMVRRLLKRGHQCVVFDRSSQAVAELVEEKASGATSLQDLVRKLERRGALAQSLREIAGPASVFHRTRGQASGSLSPIRKWLVLSFDDDRRK